MSERNRQNYYHIIDWAFASFLCGFVLDLVLPPSLISISSIGKLPWFQPINKWMYKGLFMLCCALYLAFNLAILCGARCKNRKDEQFIWGASIVGVIIAEFVSIGIFLDSPRGGMAGEILAALFVGAIFVIGGLIPKAIYIWIVKQGIRIGFLRRNSEKWFVPHIIAFVLLIIALSLNFYVLSAFEKANADKELNTAKRNTTDSLSAVQAKFQNNENMFKHWVVRPDSVREYSYRIHHKRGYYIDLVKEVNKLGNPICLRRKVFSRDNQQISEDTVTIAKLRPSPPIPDGGITSLVAVNYLFKYDRKEFTREDLVKWCNSVILSGLLVEDDARNIMFIVAQISISDKPEFRLSEDGLHELISRLAIAARHTSL